MKWSLFRRTPSAQHKKKNLSICERSKKATDLVLRSSLLKKELHFWSCGLSCSQWRWQNLPTLFPLRPELSNNVPTLKDLYEEFSVPMSHCWPDRACQFPQVVFCLSTCNIFHPNATVFPHGRTRCHAHSVHFPIAKPNFFFHSLEWFSRCTFSFSISLFSCLWRPCNSVVLSFMGARFFLWR